MTAFMQTDWLDWPSGSDAFPEGLRGNLTPIGDLVDGWSRELFLQDDAALEAGDRSRLRSKLGELGPLGLLGVEVPVVRGGGGLSTVESCRISEGFGRLGGFTTAYVAHAGLATIPIATYADDDLAAAYLPRLMSGEWIGGYCLTEPGSGSDAQGAKTRATPVDGGWSLSGAKAWITNGGIADLFVVFAQFTTSEGPRFSACVVERSWRGVSIGADERKLGMHGSSTTAVTFDAVFVPSENVIGELGAGAKIAFGTLNAGRMKVGAGGVGASRELLRQCVAYADQRLAFGKPIYAFPAIREKLAIMAARTFALEAAVYRVASAIDAEKVKGAGRHAAMAARQGEAALIKVMGSEILAYCADEAIQIHGGNGFSEEFAPARIYRDARVQRIFEGTSEINRALAAKTFFKRWTSCPGGKQRVGRTSAIYRVLEKAMETFAERPANINEAAAAPLADLLIAYLEADSAVLRARHSERAAAFAPLVEVAVGEAERRVLDAALRLPVDVKTAAAHEIGCLFELLAKADRDAAIEDAAHVVDDPIFI